MFTTSQNCRVAFQPKGGKLVSQQTFSSSAGTQVFKTELAKIVFNNLNHPLIAFSREKSFVSHFENRSQIL